MVGALKTYTSSQLKYLDRLDRLERLLKNKGYVGESYPPQIMREMIAKSSFATFRDCNDEKFLDVGEEALEVIKRYRQ